MKRSGSLLDTVEKPAAETQYGDDLKPVITQAKPALTEVPEGPAVRAWVEKQGGLPPEPEPVKKSIFSRKPTEDVVPKTQQDRRLLPHVPARSGIRSGADRRGKAEVDQGTGKRVITPSLPEHRGVRYEVEDLPVKVTCYPRNGLRQSFTAQARNISTSGMQITLASEAQLRLMRDSDRLRVSFRLKPGMMPEGYEMPYDLDVRAVFAAGQDKGYMVGLAFDKPLPSHAYTHRGRWMFAFSIMAFAVLVSLIILMRVNSASLGTVGRVAYVYSIITSAYLLTRYLFGALYKPTPVNPNFTPGVSIVIPCYDEEEWIRKTIISCLDQAYPREQLEVIIVDDHSRDNSPAMIQKLLEELYAIDDLYDTKSRVRYVRQSENLGKREAMSRGSSLAKHDLIVFVDSDSFLDPYAIRHLVQPFQDPKVGGVSGRTDVANSYTNMLTKMQAVKYYFSFRVLKAAEGYFDAVTCLSGPLSCYRRDALEKNMDAWLNQRFFGMKATFGDDRSMTNFVLRDYRTDYQDTAICATIVPKTHRMFLRQQMRWKRSWLRESSIAAGYMWRKEPLMALSFYIGFLLPIVSPFIVLLNLVFLPLFMGVVPITFIIGFFSMSIMMCFAQLLMRRSSIWLYGLVYNLYHILVLVWQMPIAWFTFWKSTWGTRMTTSDLKARGMLAPEAEPARRGSREGYEHG